VNQKATRAERKNVLACSRQNNYVKKPVNRTMKHILSPHPYLPEERNLYQHIVSRNITMIIIDITMIINNITMIINNITIRRHNQ
jgi:hypothetical protein